MQTTWEQDELVECEYNQWICWKEITTFAWPPTSNVQFERQRRKILNCYKVQSEPYQECAEFSIGHVDCIKNVLSELICKFWQQFQINSAFKNIRWTSKSNHTNNICTTDLVVIWSRVDALPTARTKQIITLCRQKDLNDRKENGSLFTPMYAVLLILFSSILLYFGECLYSKH